MFLICIILGKYISDNKISIIVQVILGGITYAGCLLVLKDKFVFKFLTRAKNKIKGDF